MIGDVGNLAGGLAELFHLEVRVQNRRTLLHRVGRGKHSRQNFVLDIDQRRRFFGDMDVDGRHRRHGMALVEHLAYRQHVALDVAERRLSFAQIHDLIGSLRQVCSRNHRLDAFERFRLGRIDALDARMRVRTAQDRAVQQPRHLEIGPIDGSARNFVGAVVPNRPRADHAIWLSAHAWVSRICLAASCTARMILS